MLPRCWGAYPVGQHDVIYRVVPLWQGCDHGTLAGYCIQVKTGKVCICTACTATYPAQGNHTLAGNEQHTLAGCLCVLHVPKVMGRTPCGAAHPVQGGTTLLYFPQTWQGIYICTACTATYPSQGIHTLTGNEHTLAGS